MKLTKFLEVTEENYRAIDDLFESWAKTNDELEQYFPNIGDVIWQEETNIGGVIYITLFCIREHRDRFDILYTHRITRA